MSAVTIFRHFKTLYFTKKVRALQLQIIIIIIIFEIWVPAKGIAYFDLFN
jgi:hypothetical protein